MKRRLAQLSALVLFGALFSAGEAGAQTGYKLLAPLPYIGDTAVLDSKGLTNYLQTFFNLAIAVAVGLAVVMIVIGGAQYLSTDALTGKTEGRSKLTNAVWGLVLALGVFVILNTVNPDILRLNLEIQPFKKAEKQNIAVEEPITTPGVTPGGGVTSVTGDQKMRVILSNEASIRSALEQTGIKINKSPCMAVGQTNCTNVGGLPSIAIERLISLQQNCPTCYIRVTGGTEYWLHTISTKHGPNNAVVDLDAHLSLNEYLTGVRANPSTTVRIEKAGALFTFENTGDNAASTGPHWHVVLNYR